MNTETKLFKFGDGSANAKTEKDEALEAGTFHKFSKLRLPTEMENRGVVEKGPKEDRQKIASEVRNIDSPQDTPNTSLLRVITGFTQNSKASRDLIPFYVIDQVGRQISRAVVKGERIIKLQLKPPELGMVRVQIDVKNNILRLSMITENSSTKELLLSNVNELRESLVEQGMKVEKIAVDINCNFGQSSTYSNEELGDSQRRIQEALRLPFVKGSDTERLQAAPQIRSSSNYLLDLIV
jgi:flagellar hook-length control protein FliK